MELTKKELTRLFGNITFGLSTALRLEPEIITLRETDIPCQLFKFKNKRLQNMVFCLYLDGTDFESINLGCYLCKELQNISPDVIIGEDLTKRKSQIILFNKNIPYNLNTFLYEDDYNIYNFFKNNNNVECINIVNIIRTIQRKYKTYNRLLQAITFTKDIDILLNV